MDQFQPLELVSGDISRLFEAIQSNPIQISWDVAQEQDITLPGSGHVIVPPQAFVSPDGSEVAGWVEAKILPLPAKKDLLPESASTSSLGRLFSAYGGVKIEVEQGGVPLRLAEGKRIKVRMSTARYNSQMRLFTAQQPSDWAGYNPGEVVVRSVELEDPEDGTLLPGFEMESPELGYLQCGAYLPQDEGLAEVCLNLPYGFEAANTVAFLVFRDHESLVRLPFTGEELRPDCCLQGLPIGEVGKIIVVAEGEEGVYFFRERTITIVENLTINITPERVSLSDIMLALEGL